MFELRHIFFLRVKPPPLSDLRRGGMSEWDRPKCTECHSGHPSAPARTDKAGHCSGWRGTPILSTLLSVPSQTGSPAPNCFQVEVVFPGLFRRLLLRKVATETKQLSLPAMERMTAGSEPERPLPLRSQPSGAARRRLSKLHLI